MKAIPGSSRPGGKDRFDTVIVLDDEQAEATGVQGEYQYLRRFYYLLSRR